MLTWAIILGVTVLLIAVLVALWTAPEGEETKEGFRETGPSAFARFKARICRSRGPDNRVVNWSRDPHH